MEETPPYSPMVYHYKALDFLYKSTTDCLNSVNNITVNNVFFCPYQIIESNKYPFLQFLLVNDYTEQLGFIHLQVNGTTLTDKYITQYTNYLFLQISSFFEIKPENIEYKGFTLINNDVYLFYDLTKKPIMVDNIHNNNLWFALVDEIVNQRAIYGIPISELVSDFFTTNAKFNFLYNGNNEKYEIPTATYVSMPEKRTEFTHMFGVSSKNSQSIVGPYYYFTNYENSIKQIHDHGNNPDKIGIVRFAVFLDKTNIIQNLPYDEVDESSIKKERLLDETLDLKYERLTMRISDHDGKWSKTHDSIIVPNIRLDDGSLMKDTPIICVKTYQQQWPLSYCFVKVQKNKK